MSPAQGREKEKTFHRAPCEYAEVRKEPELGECVGTGASSCEGTGTSPQFRHRRGIWPR